MNQPTLVLDTGALVAADKNQRQIWSLHQRSLRKDVVLVVPSVVLAQAWRGGPQVQLSWFLKSCDVLPLDETCARLAGRFCARAGTSDIVDGAVVAHASLHRGTIVTSDPTDIRALASANNLRDLLLIEI